MTVQGLGLRVFRFWGSAIQATSRPLYKLVGHDPRFWGAWSLLSHRVGCAGVGGVVDEGGVDEESISPSSPPPPLPLSLRHLSHSPAPSYISPSFCARPRRARPDTVVTGWEPLLEEGGGGEDAEECLDDDTGNPYQPSIRLFRTSHLFTFAIYSTVPAICAPKFLHLT